MKTQHQAATICIHRSEFGEINLWYDSSLVIDEFIFTVWIHLESLLNNKTDFKIASILVFSFIKHY